MKEIIWVGNSLKDLCDFPDDVKNEVGYALYEAQLGLKSLKAKPLPGIASGVMEIILDYDKSTFRAIYTVKISEVIYVLHCFQKKSKRGIATPKQELRLISKRLNDAKKIETLRSKQHEQKNQIH